MRPADIRYHCSLGGKPGGQWVTATEDGGNEKSETVLPSPVGSKSVISKIGRTKVLRRRLILVVALSGTNTNEEETKEFDGSAWKSRQSSTHRHERRVLIDAISTAVRLQAAVNRCGSFIVAIVVSFSDTEFLTMDQGHASAVPLFLRVLGKDPPECSNLGVSSPCVCL